MPIGKAVEVRIRALVCGGPDVMTEAVGSGGGSEGFAHGELAAEADAPGGFGDDEVLGTVTSFVDSRREDGEDMGIGDAAGRPAADQRMLPK